MSGIIGKKIGMTSLFNEEGKTFLVQLFKLVHARFYRSEPKKLTVIKLFN
jgi:ribosomal protein L3